MENEKLCVSALAQQVTHCPQAPKHSSPLASLLEPDAFLIVASKHLDAALEDAVSLPPSRTEHVEPAHTLHPNTDRLHTTPLLHNHFERASQDRILRRRLPRGASNLERVQIVLSRWPNKCNSPALSAMM